MGNNAPIRQDVMDLANIIDNKIIADLTDRRGFQQIWDQIDSNIQNEIENQWITIIYEEIHNWIIENHGTL